MFIKFNLPPSCEHLQWNIIITNAGVGSATTATCVHIAQAHHACAHIHTHIHTHACTHTHTTKEETIYRISGINRSNITLKINYVH